MVLVIQVVILTRNSTMNNYIYFDRQCHDCILGETASRFGSLIGIRILFGYNISRNLFPVVPLAST